MKTKHLHKGDGGFSLLELVVAVGIILVLTVGGLVAYAGITKNSKQAAVNSAVDSVYTATIAYLNDGDDKTTVQTAAEEWNKNAVDSGVERPAALVTGDITSVADKDKAKVWIYVDDLGQDKIRVTGIYGKDEVRAQKISPGVEKSSENGGVSTTTPVESESTSVPENTATKPDPSFSGNERTDMTILAFTCAEETTSTVPYKGFGDQTTLITYQQPWGDQDLKKYNVNGQSTYNVTIPANQKTYLTLYGAYDELNPSLGFTNCQLDIGYIGPNSGVKKITRLPANTTWGNGMINSSGVDGYRLPSTVTNLDYLMVDGENFFNGNSFNSVSGEWQLPIEAWDTSNVTSMKGAFKGNKGSHNIYANTYKTYDLSTWNVDKVTDHSDFDADNANIIPPNFKS